MGINISYIDNPARIAFDAPYIDGISNITTALSPIDEKITFAIERSGVFAWMYKVVDLSTRIVQFLVGSVLLIMPGVNNILDLFLRAFSIRTNLYGTYEPSSKSDLFLSNIATDTITIKQVLPRFLEFLRKNDYSDASIHYVYVESKDLKPDYMKFDIKLAEGNNLSLSLPVYSVSCWDRLAGEFKKLFLHNQPHAPCVIPELPINLSISTPETNSIRSVVTEFGYLSERNIFAALKKAVVFHCKNINRKDYSCDYKELRRLNFFNLNNLANYAQSLEADIKPKICKFMEDVGIINPQFVYQVFPDEKNNQYNIEIELSSDSHPFLKLCYPINQQTLYSSKLIETIILEIVLHLQTI